MRLWARGEGPKSKCMAFIEPLENSTACGLQHRPVAPDSSVLCVLQCRAEASYGGDQRHVGLERDMS